MLVCCHLFHTSTLSCGAGKIKSPLFGPLRNNTLKFFSIIQHTYTTRLIRSMNRNPSAKITAFSLLRGCSPPYPSAPTVKTLKAGHKTSQLERILSFECGDLEYQKGLSVAYPEPGAEPAAPAIPIEDAGKQLGSFRVPLVCGPVQLTMSHESYRLQ